jgi:hypothetical protein
MVLFKVTAPHFKMIFFNMKKKKKKKLENSDGRTCADNMHE